MKKIIILALFAILTYFASACDMAAAIATDGGTMDWGYGASTHYCTLLNDNLNSCDHDDGRGVTLHNDSSSDDIYSLRVDGDGALNSNLISGYFSGSTAMLNHARVGTSGMADKAFHPFVWDSRTSNSIYTFMHNGSVSKTQLETLLEEGADDDWLNDAFDHLHDNSHNSSVTSISNICDSEYYFYWLIKNIEANRNILDGLEQALYKLDQVASSTDWRNFMFSDGEDLYLYKRGSEGTQDYDHQIFYGEVVFHPNENQGIDEYPGAYVAVTQNMPLDYDGSGYDYFDPIPSANELDDAELVVIESDGTITSYSHFGEYSSNHNYIPEVSYSMIDGVNWKCFPVDWSGYDADDQILEIYQYFEDFIYYDNGENHQTWSQLQFYDLTFDEGYKVEIDYSGREVVYDLEGCHVLEDYEIDLDSNETRFWLPYFIHGSKSPLYAFSDIIDYATKIQGEYWTMTRRKTTDSWTVAIDPGQSLLCYYGKLYDVTLVSGHPTSMDYDNIIATESLAEYVPPETEYYTYEERAEYEAVLIDTIISNDPIEEVAVFENGECIGASVFLGYPVFIRAFTTELNRSHEPLEFRIYTGERSDSDMNYRVYDEDFSLYRDEEMYPRESSITRVCLGEKGEEMPVMDSDKIHTKQYPDPFNPETSIEYSIPEQGKVTIDVYNIKGQKVRSLLSADQSSGFHKVIWNGTDDNGKRSATGMYFYILQYKDQIVKEKMLMIK